MCGIAGIFDCRGQTPIDEGLLVSMRDSMAHRGPDDRGIHTEPGVGFAHRRLSIIDLGGGHQPVWNEDGTVVVVYNGEIYNFQELTENLIACGHSFRTHSDTEVIVHAWEEWGEDCVRRFRGMFAFAIWDRSRETVFLARDRVGIKPLYYAFLPGGTLIFGSELKALMVHPDLERVVDPLAVEEFFAYGYVPEPRTIFRSARKLPPGYTLRVRRGEEDASPRQYWDLEFAEDPSITEERASTEMVDRLRDAVKVRLIAEVPLGAFLSGGVDSSAVVALMAGLLTEPVNTCSIAFDMAAYNEHEHAARVAQRYRTNHYVEEVDPNDFELVDKLVSIYDEPYADSSAIPTYRVCELGRKRVTVALSGDGGDETFAGYRRYRWHAHEEKVRSLLPLSLRRPLFGLAGRLYPKADWAPKVLRAKSTLEALSRDSVEGYFHSVSFVTDRHRLGLFSGDLRARLEGYNAVEVLQGYAKRCATIDPVSRIQYLDFKTYLPGDILTKVDRASMAHSLEVRVPILDHHYIEWAARLPARWKLRGGEGKYLFKKVFRAYLPDEILYRPKMGFAVPIEEWFRGPLRERVRESLLGRALKETGMFDMRYVERLVDQHLAGTWNHTAALWSLLMFEGFQRRLADGAATR